MEIYRDLDALHEVFGYVHEKILDSRKMALYICARCSGNVHGQCGIGEYALVLIRGYTVPRGWRVRKWNQ
jgi:hypothetical protein